MKTKQIDSNSKAAYLAAAKRAEEIHKIWEIQNLFGLTDNEPEEDEERSDRKEHGTYY